MTKTLNNAIIFNTLYKNGRFTDHFQGIPVLKIYLINCASNSYQLLIHAGIY